MDAGNRMAARPQRIHGGEIAVGKGAIEGLVGEQDSVTFHGCTPARNSSEICATLAHET
jgi:hypothetical protein